jgi:alanine dehydrogenase
MDLSQLGVIKTSKKKDEKRIPIHPEHLNRISESIRKKLIFEKGYGESFNISDEEMAKQSGGVAIREFILSELGAAIIAKPVLSDLEELKKGANSWNLNATIKNAININNGVIVKEGILDFQNRNKEYPHALK